MNEPGRPPARPARWTAGPPWRTAEKPDRIDGAQHGDGARQPDALVRTAAEPDRRTLREAGVVVRGNKLSIPTCIWPKYPEARPPDTRVGYRTLVSLPWVVVAGIVQTVSPTPRGNDGEDYPESAMLWDDKNKGA